MRLVPRDRPARFTPDMPTRARVYPAGMTGPSPKPRRMPPRYDARVEDARWRCHHHRRVLDLPSQGAGQSACPTREGSAPLRPPEAPRKEAEVLEVRGPRIVTLQYPHMLEPQELAALVVRTMVAATIIADGRGKLPVIMLSGDEPEP